MLDGQTVLLPASAYWMSLSRTAPLPRMVRPLGSSKLGGEAVDRPRRQLEGQTGRRWHCCIADSRRLLVVCPAIAPRPELFRRDAAAFRACCAALDGGGCAAACSRGLQPSVSLFCLPPHKSSTAARPRARAFILTFDLFSFSAGDILIAYHTINRGRMYSQKSRCPRDAAAAPFGTFQFSRASAQDWQAVMRLIL